MNAKSSGIDSTMVITVFEPVYEREYAVSPFRKEILEKRKKQLEEVER